MRGDGLERHEEGWRRRVGRFFGLGTLTLAVTTFLDEIG